MPTARQKKVAKLIIQNATLDKPLNGGEMLENARYSKAMQIAPGKVLESIGVQQALEEAGFTEDNAKKVVTEIMLNNEEDAQARLKATDQVFKVKGSYAPEKSARINVNLNAEVENKELEELRIKYEAELKAKLLQ